MSGGAAGEDIVQFLDDTASTYLMATYVTSEEDADLCGWWDVTTGDIGETSLDNETFASGTSYLCALTSGGEVSFTYAGEVLSGTKTIAITAGTSYPFICNPLPVSLTLSQVTLEGSSAGEDIFQFLDNTASTYKMVTYVTAEEDADLCGWWDVTTADIGEVAAGDISLAPGAAMLGAVTSGNAINVIFPAVLNN